MNMRQALNILSKRAYSTLKPRKTPSFRELTRAPVFKTLFLTIIFGSVVVESTRSRKDIEALRAAYDAKFRILREVTQKIKNKEPVDVAQELSIANSITRNKYNSVTDVQLDEQLEAFLKLVDEPESTESEAFESLNRIDDGKSTDETVGRNDQKDTKLFL